MAGRVLVIDDNLDLAANLADILEGARELDVDFVAYAAGNFDRLLRNAASDRFERAIATVTEARG